MARKKYKKPLPEAELDVTSFMNLMVVLIPFLLATAVFSQVSIQELNLPSGSGGEVADKPKVTIEIMVRKDALEISNGKVITDRFANKEGDYDLSALTAELRALKEKYPEKEDVTVLLEPNIEYNDMIAVMDTVKIYRQEQEDAPPVSEVLFPDISIGDAP
ncbi:MAG: biopolymer transporter ExbD [Pseudomonadota bacterium]|jgi:biopolymer transport protein ExbD|uniref:ExbD/TolR family protein n=1 Tax=Alcanivorax sp. TaxID=1872427 RepID=UPI0025C1B3D3|nr:biopolymer transporter ExbD [Alcanivorax sp.]MED5239984.1 biopolymer transporter ExbD [Pseudomonadota bacterium]MEE3320853.1 biopolymer transporter ExbD [Pseudomonadota bacterium]